MKDIKSSILENKTKYYIFELLDVSENTLDEIASVLSKKNVIVQLGTNSVTSSDFYKFALKVRQLASTFDSLLILQDRLDIAKLVEADGIFLNNDSIDVSIIKNEISKNMLIGCTYYSNDCDYIVANSKHPDKFTYVLDSNEKYKAKIISESNIAYHSPYLDFKFGNSPSGKKWHYVKRTNDSDSHDSAVAITTLVKKSHEYNFLFLKTKRPPIYCENKAQYCLESPAGLIGDDDKKESLIECAKKELLEEAGLKTDKFYIELENSSTSAGLSSETISYITAIVDNDIIVNQPVSDGGIITERIYVPVKDINNYLNSLDYKKISVSAALVCGVYYALLRLNKG